MTEIVVYPDRYPDILSRVLGSCNQLHFTAEKVKLQHHIFLANMTNSVDFSHAICLTSYQVKYYKSFGDLLFLSCYFETKDTTQ